MNESIGLPISPYFSALKIKWLKDNLPEIDAAFAVKTCLVGTIDSWIIWVGLCLLFIYLQNAQCIRFISSQNLTGGVKSGQHVTDVTNASRTLLMNLHTLKWDDVSIIFNQLNFIANNTNLFDHWFRFFHLMKVMHYVYITVEP